MVAGGFKNWKSDVVLPLYQLVKGLKKDFFIFVLLELNKRLKILHVALASKLVEHNLVAVVKVVDDKVLDHVL